MSHTKVHRKQTINLEACGFPLALLDEPEPPPLYISEWYGGNGCTVETAVREMLHHFPLFSELPFLMSNACSCHCLGEWQQPEYRPPPFTCQCAFGSVQGAGCFFGTLTLTPSVNANFKVEQDFNIHRGFLCRIIS